MDSKSRRLIDVGPWLPAMRRRARDMVIMQELEALEQSLRGKNLERVKLLRRLISDGGGGSQST